MHKGLSCLLFSLPTLQGLLRAFCWDSSSLLQFQLGNHFCCCCCPPALQLMGQGPLAAVLGGLCRSLRGSLSQPQSLGQHQGHLSFSVPEIFMEQWNDRLWEWFELERASCHGKGQLPLSLDTSRDEQDFRWLWNTRYRWAGCAKGVRAAPASSPGDSRRDEGSIWDSRMVALA